MKNYINPKNVYYFLRYFGKLIAIWPLKINATKNEVLIHTFKWWIAFTNVIALLIPLNLAVYYFYEDSIKITRSLSEMTALCEIFLNMLASKVMEKKFQIILHEIDQFIEKADKQEEAVMQKYVNRYKCFHILVGLSFILTAIIFTFIPLVSLQLLPGDVWYPFSTDSRKVQVFLYTQQVVAIFQVGIGISMDLIVAMMLWYSAARVELLEIQVNRALSTEKLKCCARNYQELVIFTSNVMEGIRFIILKSNVLMTGAIICGAFQLIQHPPIEILLRFVLMVTAGCFRLYVSAQPASDLRENCESLARSSLYVASQQKSPAAARIAIMLAFRSQKPFVLSIAGLIKSYSVESYAEFLSKTMSYFVSLRAVLEK